MATTTLNPSAKGTVFTLSNGNLTATHSGAGGSVLGVTSKNTGKSYFEVRYVSGGNLMVGIANISLPLNEYVYVNQYQRSYVDSNGHKTSTVDVAYGATYNVGDYIGIAVDMDGGNLTFYKNGTSQGVAFTDLSTLSPVYPLITTYGSAAFVCTCNFGATAFQYAAPSGYSAWNASIVRLCQSIGGF